MSTPVIQSMKENKKFQKHLLTDECMEHFASPKFNTEDRKMIAKLRKQDYKEGFQNCFKMLKK